MISVSPSLVSSFEYWLTIEDADRSDEKRAELIDQIKRVKRPKSLPLRLGSAWHACMELPDVMALRMRLTDASTGAGAVLTREGGIEIDVDSIRIAQSHHPPDLIREVPGRLALPEIDVSMSLRADGLRANEVHEIKSTGKPINEAKVRNFEASVQWRAYLLAFDCDVCWYHVTHLTRNRSSGVYFAADYLPLSMYRYPGMRDDVARRVSVVADWIRSEGLEKYRPVYEERMP